MAKLPPPEPSLWNGSGAPPYDRHKTASKLWLAPLRPVAPAGTTFPSHDARALVAAAEQVRVAVEVQPSCCPVDWSLVVPWQRSCLDLLCWLVFLHRLPLSKASSNSLQEMDAFSVTSLIPRCLWWIVSVLRRASSCIKMPPRPSGLYSKRLLPMVWICAC